MRVFGITVVLSFGFRGSPFIFNVTFDSVAVAALGLALLPREVDSTERAVALGATVDADTDIEGG